MSLSQKSKKHQQLSRLRTYDLKEVLPHIGETYHTFDGKKIRMRSEKYRVFQNKGTNCYGCGMKGVFFALERLPEINKYHFNLYAIDKEGDEVLMTIDHIHPKSKGGPSSLENFQPLCKVCNERKADREGRSMITSRFFSPTKEEFIEIVKAFALAGHTGVAKALLPEEIGIAYASQDKTIKCLIVIQNLLYEGVGKNKRQALTEAISRNRPYNF